MEGGKCVARFQRQTELFPYCSIVWRDVIHRLISQTHQSQFARTCSLSHHVVVILVIRVEAESISFRSGSKYNSEAHRIGRLGGFELDQVNIIQVVPDSSTIKVGGGFGKNAKLIVTATGHRKRWLRCGPATLELFHEVVDHAPPFGHGCFILDGQVSPLQLLL